MSQPAQEHQADGLIQCFGLFGARLSSGCCLSPVAIESYLDEVLGRARLVPAPMGCHGRLAEAAQGSTCNSQRDKRRRLYGPGHGRHGARKAMEPRWPVEIVHAARELSRRGVPTWRIRAFFCVSYDTLYYWLRGADDGEPGGENS